METVERSTNDVLAALKAFEELDIISDNHSSLDKGLERPRLMFHFIIFRAVLLTADTVIDNPLWQGYVRPRVEILIRSEHSILVTPTYALESAINNNMSSQFMNAITIPYSPTARSRSSNLQATPPLTCTTCSVSIPTILVAYTQCSRPEIVLEASVPSP